MHLFIYLCYNLHVYSTCFEISCRPTSGFYHSVLYYCTIMQMCPADDERQDHSKHVDM